VTDPTAKPVMDLFNVCYEILLLALQRFFAHTEESDARLAVLADAAVTLMIRVIKPLIRARDDHGCAQGIQTAQS
jgi:hypothetical protein